MAHDTPSITNIIIDMAARQAKKHLNESQDFLCITRVKSLLYVDYQDNDSLNLLADLAITNDDFYKYLQAVIDAVDENKKRNNEEAENSEEADQPSSD
jgi:hypothetical protein